MEALQKMVLQFFQAMGHPWRMHPTPDIPIEEANLRLRLIDEEIDELVLAVYERNLVEIADSLADILYVVLGCGLAFGIDLWPIFAEIHRSNMTKVGAGNDDRGKARKGDYYEPPRLQEILDKLAAEEIPS